MPGRMIDRTSMHVVRCRYNPKINLPKNPHFFKKHNQNLHLLDLSIYGLTFFLLSTFHSPLL